MSDEHLVSLQPGTVIGGRYEVVKCLGAGSMGMVYACRHRDLQGQLVAAKVLFNEVASDKVAAARFKNEIQAAYLVSHPNVVRAYDYIRDGDLIAYTMEFVGGGDLAERMSRTELMSVVDCVRLLSQMAAGVQAIHDAGIVHRDLKPENILLTNEGTVKIADFGIARKKNGPKLTEHGGVVGTIEYVAPEYMLRSQVDWRSDIYALGILAYELVTGEAPFKGESAYASISKRLQTDPEPPSRYRPDCLPQLDAVILRALERDPEQRYQSSTEMFYDLQRVAAVLGAGESNGAGILIPPESVVHGKRYVGPSLSDQGEQAHELVETQFLTSDGSLDYSGKSAPDPDRRVAVASGNVPRADAANVGRGSNRTGREDTQVIERPEEIYSPNTEGVDDDGLYDPRSQTSTPTAPDSLVSPYGSSRQGPLPRRHPRDSSIEFPSELVKKNNQRLWLLDLIILALAACSGIGFGYIFLRVFAPSFLEKLSFLGVAL